MSLRELVVVYLFVGAACAVLVIRRGAVDASRVASAAATVVLWPLWAPFALGKPAAAHAPDARDTGAIARIDRALGEAVDAAADTPMRDIFSRPVAARILSEVARVATRVGELRALAQRAGFDVSVSARRLRDLEASGSPERTVATARLQHESLLRLDKLLVDDVQALDDLADLLEALRAQLMLARYAGSSAEGAEAMVSEVWARLEGLGAVMDVGRMPVDSPT
jgi:hypothetical protein